MAIPNGPVCENPSNRILVLLNPAAGMVQPRSLERRIASHLKRRGALFRIHVISPADSVRQVVDEAAAGGYNLMAAAGGDGTVSVVADAVAGTSLLLGIIPVGTGNIIAKDLHVPLRLGEALDLLLSETRCVARLDAMRIGDRMYILMVSTGFTARVVAELKPGDKRRLGIASYLWRGLLQLAGIQPVRFTLRLDGRKMRFSASDVIITNSALIGFQPLKLDPDIRMDDGLLSVCILRARSLLDFLKIFWNMVRGRQKLAHELRWLDVRESLEIRTSPPTPVQGDGDFIGITPVRVEFVPGVIQCIVPPDYQAP